MGVVVGYPLPPVGTYAPEDCLRTQFPYNRVDGLAWERPGEEAQEAFLAALVAQDVVGTLRREKGHDIDAACGQLRLKTERELRKPVAVPAPPV